MRTGEGEQEGERKGKKVKELGQEKKFATRISRNGLANPGPRKKGFVFPF